MPGQATCNFKPVMRLAQIFVKELVWHSFKRLTAAQRAAFAADTPVTSSCKLAPRSAIAPIAKRAIQIGQILI